MGHRTARIPLLAARLCLYTPYHPFSATRALPPPLHRCCHHFSTAPSIPSLLPLHDLPLDATSNTQPDATQEPTNAHPTPINEGGKFVPPTPELAEKYLTNLRGGEVISSAMWNYYFNSSTTITDAQASEFLKYAREAHIITPKMYFYYLLRFTKSQSWIPFHLGLNTMIMDGIQLSSADYLRLTKSTLTDPNLTIRLFDQLDFHRIDADPRDRDLYAPQVLALARGVLQMLVGRGDKAQLLRFFNRLPRYYLGAPAYNFVLLFLDKQRDRAMVTALFHDMRKRNVPLNMKTYEILSRGLTSNGTIEMLEMLEESGLVPSCKFYTKIIEQYKNDYPRVLKFISEMQSKKVPMDLYAYSTIIKVHLHHGHTEEALDLLRQMVEAEIFPDEEVIRFFRHAYANTPAVVELNLFLAGINERKATQKIEATTLPIMDEEW